MIQWRKSSHSQGGEGECVEVSTNTVDTLIRDSKDPEGPRLTLGRTGLTALLGQIKAGELDLS
ncbi:DUF397 domain-containing protein [Actinomadura terrae]|uniref:DUF397 domain-containing protein n=1 Tax=Actinomadura terrae TaxID=604353 RepID=UPI001FA7605A|nr:DUF397 domain-containing protein [Actinomadura terrae]